LRRDRVAARSHRRAGWIGTGIGTGAAWPKAIRTSDQADSAERAGGPDGLLARLLGAKLSKRGARPVVVAASPARRHHRARTMVVHGAHDRTTRYDCSTWAVRSMSAASKAAVDLVRGPPAGGAVGSDPVHLVGPARGARERSAGRDDRAAKANRVSVVRLGRGSEVTLASLDCGARPASRGCTCLQGQAAGLPPTAGGPDREVFRIRSMACSMCARTAAGARGSQRGDSRRPPEIPVGTTRTAYRDSTRHLVRRDRARGQRRDRIIDKLAGRSPDPRR